MKKIGNQEDQAKIQEWDHHIKKKKKKLPKSQEEEDHGK